MKLIIDIPDYDYKFIKDLQFYNSGRRNGRTIENHVINGIRTGIPYEERPQGEWLYETKLDGIGWWYCSNCCEHKEWIGKNSNFCPNCGADMRGEENDSEKSD